MRRLTVPAAMLMAVGGCEEVPANAQSATPIPEQPSMMPVTPVEFMADDGLTVSGRYYRAPGAKALILLFHQAGSSKDEYATIAPRLADAGYAALAIDQRSGGDMFGKNATAARMPSPTGYLDALQDLEAALDWGRTMSLPIIVWGSSYSASLVFELAAKHPDQITALLSFSPGEYFGDGNSVAAAAAKVKIPVFVTSAKDAGEIAAARAIFDAVPGTRKTLVEPRVAGVHGSSTLIALRNPKGAEDNWPAVLAFIADAVK